MSACNSGTHAKLEQAVAGLFGDMLARDRSIPGVLAAIHSPPLGLNLQMAVGRLRLHAEEPLHSTHSFRIASLTKVFTAAATLRLQEEGALNLSDVIDHHLQRDTAAVLRHAGHATDRITIEQLLAHTAGLVDFITVAAYQQAVASRPQRRWTRSEQIAIAMQQGPALGPPGRQFSYGDTGHVLLGEIIENLTHEPMAAAIRRLLHFEQLGLLSTHFESLESAGAGAGPRAHQYLGSVDTTDFDPSFDLFGGGGLVSTVGELAVFWRALFRGELFSRPETLNIGLRVPQARPDPMRASHALLAAPLPLGRQSAWGHAGFWGSVALHAPATDTTVVLSINQAAPAAAFELRELVARIGSLLDTLLDADAAPV
jgi:D-alanyl-D-alanine carboxypeptidase